MKTNLLFIPYAKIDTVLADCLNRRLCFLDRVNALWNVVTFCQIGKELGVKLQKEIKNECVVISEMFPLEGLCKIKEINSSMLYVPTKIFIYKKHKQTKASAHNSN